MAEKLTREEMDESLEVMGRRQDPKDIPKLIALARHLRRQNDALYKAIKFPAEEQMEALGRELDKIRGENEARKNKP